MTTPYSVEKCGEADDENDPQSRCVEIGRDAMGGEGMDAVELRPLRGDHEKQDEIGRDEHHHPACEMEGGHSCEPPYRPKSCERAQIQYGESEGKASKTS